MQVNATRPPTQPGTSSQLPNAVTVVNDTGKPLTVLVVPHATHGPEYAITLATGETRELRFPEGWGGSLKKKPHVPSGSHTQAELQFKPDKTWFDASYVDGYNGSVTIYPKDGGIRAGTTKDLFSLFPTDMVERSGGETWLTKPYATTPDHPIPELATHYRTHISPARHEGYTFPKDDLNTASTPHKHMVVIFGDSNGDGNPAP